MEVDGEPDRSAAGEAEDRLDVAAGREELALEEPLVRRDEVRELLVLGEPADQLEQHRDVGARGGADRERLGHARLSGEALLS